MRGDVDRDRSSAHRAFVERRRAAAGDIRARPPDDEQQVGIDDRHRAREPRDQRLSTVARQATDKAEPVIGAPRPVHRLGARRGQPQRRGRRPETGNAPGGHLADAIAGDDRWPDRVETRRHRKPAGNAQDLARPVRMERRIVRGLQDRPDVLPQHHARIGKDRLGSRLSLDQLEHRTILPTLAGAQQRQRHAPHASTNSAIASRSAQPPGLSRRAVKARWSPIPCSRQSGAATPPASRKSRALVCAKESPSTPPR